VTSTNNVMARNGLVGYERGKIASERKGEFDNGSNATNIIIVGDSNVGKSSFLRTFFHGLGVDITATEIEVAKQFGDTATTRGLAGWNINRKSQTLKLWDSRGSVSMVRDYARIERHIMAKNVYATGVERNEQLQENIVPKQITIVAFARDYAPSALSDCKEVLSKLKQINTTHVVLLITRCDIMYYDKEKQQPTSLPEKIVCDLDFNQDDTFCISSDHVDPNDLKFKRYPDREQAAVDVIWKIVQRYEQLLHKVVVPSVIGEYKVEVQIQGAIGMQKVRDILMANISIVITIVIALLVIMFKY